MIMIMRSALLRLHHSQDMLGVGVIIPFFSRKSSGDKVNPHCHSRITSTKILVIHLREFQFSIT